LLAVHVLTDSSEDVANLSSGLRSSRKLTSWHWIG
jgi:hypothetical protein